MGCNKVRLEGHDQKIIVAIVVFATTKEGEKIYIFNFLCISPLLQKNIRTYKCNLWYILEIIEYMETNKGSKIF